MRLQVLRHHSTRQPVRVQPIHPPLVRSNPTRCTLHAETLATEEKVSNVGSEILSILALPRDRMSRAAMRKRLHERAVRVRFYLIHGSLVLSILPLFLAIYSRRTIYVLLFVRQAL